MEQIYRTALILCFCWLALAGNLYAQFNSVKKDSDSTKRPTAQTISKEGYRKRLKDVLNENLGTYYENKAGNIQRERLNDLEKYSTRVAHFFRKGMDTTSVRANIKVLDKKFSMAVDQIFESPDQFLPARSLTTSELLVAELSSQVDKESRKVKSYLRTVESMRLELDSLVVDTAIYVLPSDELRFQYTVDALGKIYRRLKPIDSLLQRAEFDLLSLDTELDALLSRMSVSVDNIEQKRRYASANIFKQEIPYIWQVASGYQPLRQTIATSYFKATEVLFYFTQNNKIVLSLLVVVLIALAIFIVWAKSSIIKGEISLDKYITNPAFDHPVLSVTFLMINIGQFLFSFPPFVFQSFLWLLSALIMLVYLRNKAQFASPPIVVLLIIFLTPVIAINLLLEPFLSERWYILLFSAAGLPFGYWLWKKRDIYTMPANLSGILLTILIVCELSSLTSIIFGRYNLGKALLTAGYYTVLAGMFLYWTDILLNKLFEMAADAFHGYDQQEIRSKIIRLHKSLQGLIRALVYIGALFIFLRNFYIYNIFIDFLQEVLEKQRVVGTMSFTYKNIGVFIFVILLASLLSKVVAFIFDDANFSHKQERGKGGLKNWTLVAKLSIIIFGIVLAFAAAEMELGRITIILGALGVGIGFGLQTIVNNLLSGVVLAFERPIEIGDQVEVAGRLGTIKEIGIRSSKLHSFDGSEVIIPNGDLLNQHVVNWTLSNNQRRVELIVGVRYGSDLNKIKLLLEGILNNNPRIERYPLSMVLLHDFSESSIAYRLLFWTDVMIWFQVKSEVILAVNECFNQNGIEIPFPQLDIHMKDTKSSGG